MRNSEKIKFTLAAIAMGWIMLLFMPRLPGESPANGVEIFIYALVNLYAMVRVNRWFKEINR
jgi:hypothetical protein